MEPDSRTRPLAGLRELATILPYFLPYRAAMAWGMALVVVANGFRACFSPTF